jgi:hypothetical protein
MANGPSGIAGALSEARSKGAAAAAHAPTQAYAAVATAHAPSPSGNQVTPMPDRLRDLIIGQARGSLPTRTPLIEFEPINARPASENPVAPEQVRQIRADMIAGASVSLAAQANHTRDSVSFLLNLEGVA